MSEVLMKQVIDALTGESVTVPLTDAEAIAHKKMQDNYVTLDSINEAREIARASAVAKLAALGLTADEVAAL
jgi:adenylate kinase